MNVILIANGTSENHGCEAITVSTRNILDGIYKKLYCSTTHLAYEKPLPEGCEWVEYSYFRKPTLFNRAVGKAERMMLKTNRYAEDRPWIKPLCDAYKHCDVALSCGGDNYCNGSYEWLYKLHREAKRNGLRTVLWGASVDRECLSDLDMQKDLLLYDAVSARESLTFHILETFHPNVYLYPDPAFTLPAEYRDWPAELPEGADVIGINMSPTAMACERVKGILLKNYHTLIRYILTETNDYVALIPHVVFHGKGGDYEILKSIFEKYQHTGRVMLIGDCPCTVLKGYISRCRLFVTARTHASIAAYSSCVPTLVVGYSIKARGIAVDLFGAHERYVLPVQDLRGDGELLEEFMWLRRHEDEVKKHLREIMPGYILRAYEARKLVTGRG